MPKKRKSSKKPAKASKKAKKEDKKMTQTHAKEEKFQPSTLDQVWGDTGNTKYGTMDEAKYNEQLDEMNKSDLQAHAGRVGFVPIDDRGLLTKKLLSEFRKYVSGFRKPTPPSEASNAVSKKARKILSEGR